MSKVQILNDFGRDHHSSGFYKILLLQKVGHTVLPEDLCGCGTWAFLPAGLCGCGTWALTPIEESERGRCWRIGAV